MLTPVPLGALQAPLHRGAFSLPIANHPRATIARRAKHPRPILSKRTAPAVICPHGWGFLYCQDVQRTDRKISTTEQFRPAAGAVCSYARGRDQRFVDFTLSSRAVYCQGDPANGPDNRSPVSPCPGCPSWAGRRDHQNSCAPYRTARRPTCCRGIARRSLLVMRVSGGYSTALQGGAPAPTRCGVRLASGRIARCCTTYMRGFHC